MSFNETLKKLTILGSRYKCAAIEMGTKFALLDGILCESRIELGIAWKIPTEDGMGLWFVWDEHEPTREHRLQIRYEDSRGDMVTRLCADTPEEKLIECSYFIDEFAEILVRFFEARLDALEKKRKSNNDKNML